MKGNAYTALGWLVWLVGKRVVARKLQQTRVRVAAGGLVVLVIAIGLAAARATSDG